MSAHLAAYEEAQWQAKKREEQNSTFSGAQLVDEHSRLQSPTTVGGMRRVVDLNKPNLFNNYGKTTFKDYELHIPHALSSDVRALRGAHTRGRSSLTTTAPTFAPSAQLHPVPHHVLPRPSAPEVDPSPSKPGLELFPSRPGTSGGGGLSDDDSHSLASFGPPSTVVSRPNTRGTQGSLADSRPVTQGSLETPQFGERPATSDAPVVPRRTETTSSRPSSEGSQRKVAFADEAAKDSEHRRAPSGEGRRSALGRSSGRR